MSGPNPSAAPRRLVRRTLPTLATIVAIAVFVAAGNWQRGRMDDKAALRAQLDAALETVGGNVVVDLAGVTFLDSSGIGVLVKAAQRSHATGHTLRTRAERDNVWRTLQVTNLADLFHPDRD